MHSEILELIGHYATEDDQDVRYVIVRELCGGLQDERKSSRSKSLLSGLENDEESLDAVTRTVILESLSDTVAVRSVVAGQLLPKLGKTSAAHVAHALIEYARDLRDTSVLTYLLALRDVKGAIPVSSEEDVMLFVLTMREQKERSNLWDKVLKALCVGGIVQDSDLIREIFHFGNVGTCIEVARGSSSALIGPLLASSDNLVLLTSVAEVCPMRFSRVLDRVIKRWLGFALQGTAEDGLKLLKSLGPYLNVDEALMVSVRCASELLDAVKLVFADSSEPRDMCIVDSGCESDEKWDFCDDEADMLENEEDSDLDSRTKEGLSVIHAALRALSSLPKISEEAFAAINELPVALHSIVKSDLLISGAKHPKLLDFVILSCKDVAPESLHRLTHSQVADIVKFGHSKHIPFLKDTNAELETLMNQRGTGILQKWQNHRTASKNYLDATLRFVHKVLNHKSSAVEDYQWCIDTLTWIGEKFPFYRDPLLKILIPELMPPKRFVKVIQVGNMKQKQDDTVHARTSLAVTLLHWIFDRKNKWSFDNLELLLSHLRYLLRDSTLRKHALSLFKITMQTYGDLLLIKNQKIVEDTVKQFEIEWPDGAGEANSVFVYLSLNL